MSKNFSKNNSKKKKSKKLALIGMSGAGKSFWSEKIERLGYRRYSCDDLIADKLGLKIGAKDKSTLDLAHWMGKPYKEGYLEAESIYLELEKEVMITICEELESCILKNDPVVVDTTGSLIYLNKGLLNRFRSLVRTVHLNLPVKKHKEFFEVYLSEPKPLIWKGKYIPKENESQKSTLRRCYSELLSFRKNRYISIADCELDYSFHHCSNTKVNEFLEMVGKF
tara:strand:- start:946 stop:1617 length:672 start_codon:yes stop_codon:yes gene_type:complete